MKLTGREKTRIAQAFNALKDKALGDMWAFRDDLTREQNDFISELNDLENKITKERS